MEYSKSEPFLSDRVEIMLAKNMELFANVNRGPKSEPYSLTDFMITYEKKEPKQKTLAEQIEGAMSKIAKG